MTDADALHHYLEASALAFADRGAYVGDPAYVDVPLRDAALATGSPPSGPARSTATARADQAGRGRRRRRRTTARAAAPAAGAGRTSTDTENVETTNLTVADKWGNVVEYTLTIEQTGGSGIVVPGPRLPAQQRADRLLRRLRRRPTRTGSSPASARARRCRRRSCSSDGKPFLALGSPGGSTIITTVLQMLFNRIDRGMTLPQAIAAPRASQRNTADGDGRAGVHRRLRRAADAARPHVHAGRSPGTSAAEIGAATAIEFRDGGLLVAVSEPVRRGGGSALVVRPGR